MKVLVTGGAGFIGSNFVRYMVKKYPEYNIVNLDSLTYAGNLENLKDIEELSNYKFVKGDIADRQFINQLFKEEKFDYVLNFAENHMLIEVLQILISLFKRIFKVHKYY